MATFFPSSSAAGSYLISDVRVIDPAQKIDQVTRVLVSAQRIAIAPVDVPDDAIHIDGSGLWAVPGLIDLQVHFREPGFEYKETLETGSKAALAGGITTVVVMPNTRPALDNADAVRWQSTRASEVDGVRILVAAGATLNISGDTLSDYKALKQAGAVAVTDDGYPVSSPEVMRASLEACVEHDLLFMQHAEDLSVSAEASMTLSPVSERLGVSGQSADAEGVMVERDVQLAEKTGARYHVLHMSTARSLNAVRGAKARGANVSCEASPHHLFLTYERVGDGDTFAKMNPPLRSEQDRQALIEGIVDGTIDAVATDHAPHALEEKERDFESAPNGIIGLETAFASVLKLKHEGHIDDIRAVELMTSGPARVLRRTDLGTFGPGAKCDLTLIDPDAEWTFDRSRCFGKQHNSPFLGETFRGRVLATFKDGALRFSEGLSV